MDFKFLGGGDEVGCVGCLVEDNGRRLLIDYGMKPEDPPVYPAECPDVAGVLLTHSHLDHCGMIPWICGRYGAPVHQSRVTQPVAELLARDSLKIAKLEGYPEPYGQYGIEMQQKQAELFDFGAELEVAGHRVDTYPAGHIPGSTMYLLDDKVLFTGDLNLVDTHLLDKPDPVPCETLFIESTYSGREQEPRRDVEQTFLDHVDRVLDRGGKVVVGSFAVGRTQEMLMVLNQNGYNMAVDGMGVKVGKDYMDHPEFVADPGKLKKAFDDAWVVYNHGHRKKALRDCDVFVTTSGMLEGGPAMFYIENLRDDEKSAILTTGYQVEGTNGRKLLDEGKMDFRGVEQEVKMEAANYDFSAHAGHSELVQFAHDCGPDRVVLFHGEGDERLPLKKELEGDGFDVELATNGERIEV